MNFAELHRRAATRIVGTRVWDRAVRGLMWGAVVGSCVSVVHALVGLPWGWPLAGAPLGAVVGGITALWRGAPSRSQVAHELDRRLGLKEAALTESWLEARGDPSAPDEGLAPLVAETLRGRLATITPRRVREIFPYPRRARHLATAAIFLSVAALASPRIPSLRTEDPALRKKEQEAAERRKQDAAARKLVARVKKDASELEKLAAQRRWEKLLAAAKTLGERAGRLERDFPGAPRAKVRMEAWAKEVSQAIEEAVDGASASGRGRPDVERDEQVEEMTAIARALEALDLQTLTEDMAEAARALRDAAERGAGEGENEEIRRALDARRLGDLKERLESAVRRLEELRRLLEEHPELKDRLGKLAREQSEILQQITEELNRLLQELEGGSSDSLPTPEELKKLAELMKSLSTEDLRRILEALRELEALHALQNLAQSAARGNSMPSLDRLLQGFGQGPDAGIGSGAPRPKAETANTQTKSERLHGQIDPEGRVIRRRRFRGLPRTVSSKEELDRLAELVEGAQEGLIRRGLPPSARPWVKKYFEALRAASRDGGKH